METSLEVAVRAYVRGQLEPTVGRSPRLDAETIARLVEVRVAEALSILRETLADEAKPTEADLFNAEMEASHRKIEGMIARMRNSQPEDPRRREILSALANDAEANLAAFRTFGPDVIQERLDEVAREVLARAKALNARFGFNRSDTTSDTDETS